MAQFNAHFRNINGDDTYPLTDVIYRSKVDGSLLEVEHDRAALASKSPDEWKKLFAERRMSFEPADMSGIWSKREMVLPDMPLEDIVTMREGWSPLFDAAPLAKEMGIKSLKVKLCGNSHTGSFKDLGMTVLVSQVNHIIKKKIHEIDAVACASTGDTSAALSAYCAKAGIPSIVFLPAGKTSVAQLIQPISKYRSIVTDKTPAVAQQPGFVNLHALALPACPEIIPFQIFVGRNFPESFRLNSGDGHRDPFRGTVQIKFLFVFPQSAAVPAGPVPPQ